MHPPKPTDGDGQGGEPVLGAASANDPGYRASLTSGTVLGQMRSMVLVLVVAPVLILAISPLIVRDSGDRFAAGPLWAYLLLPVVAVATTLIAIRVPGPLRPGPGTPAPEVARAALMQFRQSLLLRFALSEAVILVGLLLALIEQDEPLFVLGFVLGYPALIRLTLPTRGNVERIRRRLEAKGAESHLWAALLAPGPPKR